MLDKNFNILIVDDAEDSRYLLEVMLSDRFSIQSVDSGQACLDRVANQAPGLILLDIHMPGMDGFDVCRRLKANSQYAKIPIIVVSGSESIEERLKAYEEGAADYVSKPFDIEILNSKIDAAVLIQKEIQLLEARSAMAMSTAMEAMTASGEMGVLMSFVRTSVAVTDFNELGKAMLVSIGEFGLSGCLMISKDVGYCLFACDEISMEGKVLLGVKNDNQVLEFGKRVVIVKDGIRLLIKNMPVENESKYGRIKDNLNVLCDCANSRANSLRMAYSMQKSRDQLMEQIIKKSESQLESVHVRVNQHADESKKIMQHLVEDLEARLFSLGLEDDQEKSLRHLAEDASDRIVSLTAMSHEIHKSVNEVMQGLYHLVQNE